MERGARGTKSRSHEVMKSRFTLVELLVVVAIVGILASLLLPGLDRARKRALVAACASNLRQLYLSTALYANDHDLRLPPVFGETNGYEAYSYGAWAVPTYRYAHHINQPATTALVRDYVGSHVESLPEKPHALRCPAHRGGLYRPASTTTAIGPDGKGQLYSTYAYYYMGFYTEKHLTFSAARPFHSVYPHRLDIMQTIADTHDRRFAVFGDNVGQGNDSMWTAGSNHGVDKWNCEGGNFAFADGGVKWFPFRYRGTDLLTAQLEGWYKVDKAWFADQSQGRRWIPNGATTLGSDVNGGVGNTYVGLGVGSVKWGKRYVQSTGELLGGVQPW